MKTYKIDIATKLSKYSRDFEIPQSLCDKTWQIFDDLGKQILIHFKSDYSALISDNGNLASGTWRHENSSIVLTFGQFILTLKLCYNNGDFLIFYISGGTNCLVLFELQEGKTIPQTLDNLNYLLKYTFDNIDPVIKAAADQQEQAKAEKIKSDIEQIAEQCDNYPKKRNHIIAISIGVLLLISGIYVYNKYHYYDSVGISLMILSVVISAILYGFFDTQRWQTAVKNMVTWFRDHEETEIIEYLKSNKKLKTWFIENYDFDPTRIKHLPTAYD